MKTLATISEVADQFRVSAYTLRYYEREGLVYVPKSANGRRNYDQQAIDTIQANCHYRRVVMSLNDIRKIQKDFHNHELSVHLLEETRRRLDDQIAELETTRNYLIHKISLHQQSLTERRSKKHD